MTGTIRRRDVLVDVMSLGVGAAVLAWPSFAWPLSSLDESVVIVYADQVKAGLVPQRDFYTVYGPAPFYILAGLFAALGSALTVERVFGLMIHLVIALGCYGIGRSRDRATALIAGCASLILLAPLGVVAYAWLGGVACLATALALVERRRRSSDLLAGVAMGLASAFRPELLIVLPPLVACLAWRSPRWRSLVAGVALGVAPMVAFLLYAGPRMWSNIGPGRAAVNGSLRLSDDPMRAVAIGAAVLGVTVVLIRLAGKRRTRASVVHAVFALVILPQTLQRMDPEHAMYTLCVTAPLLVVGTAAEVRSPDLMRRRRTLLVAMAIAGVGSLTAMVLRPLPVTTTVQFSDRSALIESADLPALTQTRAALLTHSPPGGSLFVGAADMSRDSLTHVLVYHLVPELRPASYFLDLTGGASSRGGSGLADDVRKADVLLLTRVPDGLMQQISPYARPGSDEANAVVRTEFCPVAQTEWGVVYRHRPCLGSSAHRSVIAADS